MYYHIIYTDGDEATAATIGEALAAVRQHLAATFAPGWRIESDAGGKTDEEIVRDYNVTGTNSREWVIVRNIDVADSVRDFAYIEELDDATA